MFTFTCLMNLQCHYELSLTYRTASKECFRATLVVDEIILQTVKHIEVYWVFSIKQLINGFSQQFTPDKLQWLETELLGGNMCMKPFCNDGEYEFCSPWEDKHYFNGHHSNLSYFEEGQPVPGEWQITPPREQDDLRKIFPCLKETVICPLCYVQKSLFDVIVHLNDKHTWTREKIADWVDELDLEQEAKLIE